MINAVCFEINIDFKTSTSGPAVNTHQPTSVLHISQGLTSLNFNLDQEKMTHCRISAHTVITTTRHR